MTKTRIFCRRLYSRFSSKSRSLSFLLRDRRLFAPRSPAGRSKPCEGRPARPQSGADFIISLAVAQNGCFLEQFSLPGRLAGEGIACLKFFFTALILTARIFPHTCVSGGPAALNVSYFNLAPQDNAVTCVYVCWWPSACSSRILPPKTKWTGASNQSSCLCIRVLPKPHPQSTRSLPPLWTLLLSVRSPCLVRDTASSTCGAEPELRTLTRKCII